MFLKPRLFHLIASDRWEHLWVELVKDLCRGAIHPNDGLDREEWNSGTEQQEGAGGGICNIQKPDLQ